MDEALGLVLARDVVAAVTLPPWDNSAMDGYAVRAGDVAAASDDAPSRLTITGEVPAGGVADREVEHGSRNSHRDGRPDPGRRRCRRPGRGDDAAGCLGRPGRPGT